MSEIFSPSYSLPTDVNTSELSELGEQTLEEILDTCESYGADATLYDEAGFVRGWVRADRTYRLQ